MISEISLITLITITIMFILYLFKLCLNSKCDNCNLCFGLIKIHRNVNLELQLDKYKIDNKIDDLEGLNNINNVMMNKHVRKILITKIKNNFSNKFTDLEFRNKLKKYLINDK